MDDRRAGSTIRVLRRRRGWRQLDLANRSGVSQSTISAFERGHVGASTIAKLRLLLGALDAKVDLEIRWRGLNLDRTLDEYHARLVGTVVEHLRRWGWQAQVEVTYSVYGERGSIDILAFHGPSRSLLVVEVKTELNSIEETLRRKDEKCRLAGRIVRERFEWTAATTSRVLVIAERSTARRRVRAHAAVLDFVLPARGSAMRRWLAEPVGTIHGLWFLPLIAKTAARRGSGGPDRVRRRTMAPTPTPPRTNSVSNRPLERPTAPVSSSGPAE